MYDLEGLFTKIKNADDEGNLIIPKEYLKKFILSNLLIIKDNIQIDKNDIFNYLQNDVFELPSNYDILDDEKKKKYLKNLETLIRLFYL